MLPWYCPSMCLRLTYSVLMIVSCIKHVCSCVWWVPHTFCHTPLLSITHTLGYPTVAFRLRTRMHQYVQLCNLNHGVVAANTAERWAASLKVRAVQASMVHAAEVNAGSPFVLKLTLQSHLPLLQTLDVVLKDSTGFVTSGQCCLSIETKHAALRCAALRCAA